jgi:hypothetical protein
VGDYKKCYPEGMMFFGLVIIVMLSAILIFDTIELLVGKPSASMFYTTWTSMILADGMLAMATFLLVYGFIEYFKCEDEILFRRIEELKRRCRSEEQ